MLSAPCSAPASAAIACISLFYRPLADAQGKALLSINEHPDIRALFKDFRTTRLELAYSINHDKTQKTSGELVICNW